MNENQSPKQEIKAEGGSTIQNVTQEYHEHHHYSPTMKPSLPLDRLPPKNYHRLVGRSDELDKVVSALHDKERKPIVALYGLGGIGKTTLAREAAENCVKEGIFEYIVWVSAKTERFVGEAIVKTEVAVLTFDELLSEIARQCEDPNIGQMPRDQKQAAVKNLLNTHRVLIVLDNLETVIDKDELVDKLYQVLGKSKILVTSRHHVKHDLAFSINLTGLPDEDGVSFLREESRERGVIAVAEAKQSILLNVHEVTGGAPLAIKLVVGQLSYQSLDVVLSAIQKAKFKGQDYEFYRFVYRRSWEMLSEHAKNALVDMAVFPPRTGGALDDVAKISKIEPDIFWNAMVQLVSMSLVDKLGPAGEERFALHPLTYYFVRSDIIKVQDDNERR